jgi:hypothetical protein
MDKTLKQVEYNSPRGLELVSKARCWLKGKHLTSLRFKDYDVTWLYGPLQTGGSISTSCEENILCSLNKRPILKRRSTLETIFREPLHSALVGRITENNGVEQAATNEEAKHVRFSEKVIMHAY